MKEYEKATEIVVTAAFIPVVIIIGTIALITEFFKGIYGFFK